ncbi:hypothetical protein TNCV_2256801 [Trichonephila clavipes]|nr:hypothetical protein TNCV_2256801 [Trichonephila clavipes]
MKITFDFSINTTTNQRCLSKTTTNSSTYYNPKQTGVHCTYCNKRLDMGDNTRTRLQPTVKEWPSSMSYVFRSIKRRKVQVSDENSRKRC